MESNKRQEVAFNIGVAQSNFVGEVYKKIFRAFTDGDVHEWKTQLRCMREILTPDLDDEKEIPELDKKEKEIASTMNAMHKAQSKRQYQKKKNDLFDLLTDYQRDIMYYVKKSGYLPSKKDRTRLGF